MAKFIEMDTGVPLSHQMEANVSPVVLIYKINVNPDDVDQFLKSWSKDAKTTARIHICSVVQGDC
jgi:hypothetical protein